MDVLLNTSNFLGDHLDKYKQYQDKCCTEIQAIKDTAKDNTLHRAIEAWQRQIQRPAQNLADDLKKIRSRSKLLLETIEAFDNTLAGHATLKEQYQKAIEGLEDQRQELRTLIGKKWSEARNSSEFMHIVANTAEGVIREMADVLTAHDYAIAFEAGEREAILDKAQCAGFMAYHKAIGHPYVHERALHAWLKDTDALNNPKSPWFDAFDPGHPLSLCHPAGRDWAPKQDLSYFPCILHGIGFRRQDKDNKEETTILRFQFQDDGDLLDFERHSAKERDEESGLSYHGARYYASWLCRWTSPNPALCHEEPWKEHDKKPSDDKQVGGTVTKRLLAGSCPYVYVDNRPTIAFDPDGRDAIYILNHGDVGGLPYSGHPGVLAINNKMGETRYYDFTSGDWPHDWVLRDRGAYDDSENPLTPRLKMGKNGSPDSESLTSLMEWMHDHVTMNKNLPSLAYCAIILIIQTPLLGKLVDCTTSGCQIRQI
ncbi:hypothetical protein P154DRAFT_600725 [Amniculicola lignicola CBS 123094]|uniref:Uncharacterized protein n=1 Tax=Amniculicola lignicola CBS 123094 TaxID=1392246 RepID=A0A6A5WXX4_9PLEO|nr:hypothetical protein P154DRAFT_600725 [Amniculicola lignicola CBS 123094]